MQDKSLITLSDIHSKGHIGMRQKQVNNNRHSEEIQEIITKKPTWILRWGIVMWAAILFLIFGISAIVKYPETVKLPIKFEKFENQYHAVTFINENQLNKVRLGQHVRIQLTISASSESKPLQGIVTSISDAPNLNGQFLVFIKLKLSTKITKSNELKIWMTGTAQVFLKDLTIFQRLLDSCYL